MLDSDSEADAIFALIGFGRWQMVQCVWVYLFYFAWSNISLSVVIIGYVPGFVCDQPDGNCSSEDLISDGQCNWLNRTNNLSVPCTFGYIYDEPRHSSIVSEWDLVCSQSLLSEISQSAIAIGITVGGLVFPQLADRFGRRRIVVYTHAGFAIVSAATAFAPNIWVFIFARMVIGLLIFGAGNVSWVMALELFIPQHRTIAAMIAHGAWAIFACTLPLIGYLMDGMSWRHVQLVFSVFSVFWIGQMLTLCESVRWLLANGRRKEAFRIVKLAVRINKTKQESVDKLFTEYFPDAQMVNTNDTKSCLDRNGVDKMELEKMCERPLKTQQTNVRTRKTAKIPISQFFRHPTLRRVTIVMSFAWFTNSLTYYGLYLLSSAMSGNRYLNLFLSTVVEIPACMVLLPLLLRYGRRSLGIIFHASAGISLITAAILQVATSGSVASVIQTCVITAGKFSISSTFMILFLYTPEMFPTNIRSIGFGFSDVSCRIGAFVAPFATTVARAVPWVPPCVFGLLCLLVAGTFVFLPETANKDLPRTIEDLEILNTSNRNEQYPDGSTKGL